MSERRTARIARLRPEAIARYVELHEAPWPEVLDALRRHHVHNYSIFEDQGLVFSYFEYDGDRYDADMAEIRADPSSARWLALWEDAFEPIAAPASDGERITMREIFHLD